MQIRDTVPAEVHRWALAIAVGGSALVFGPRGGLEAGSAAKTVVVLLAALVALLWAGAAAVRDRAVHLPWHPAVGLAATFGVAMLGRALASDDVGVALVGPIGRANGAGMYLAGVALFLVAAARGDQRTRFLLAGTALVVGTLVAVAAIDEATVRLGPSWGERPGVAGTLGNANFLAGWSGAVLPLTAVLALDRRQARPLRVAGVVVTVLLVVASVISGSLQAGYVVAAAAAFLGLVWSYERLPRPRWRLLAGSLVGLGVVGGVLTVLGAAGTGPLSLLRDQIGVRLRAEYWAAAARMWREAPLTGVGPGQFVDRYRVARSPEAATLVDLSSSTDSAHNVPLHLFAEGGAVVGLLYLGVLVAVAVALAHALRRTEGPERLWVGAFGAAWVAYVLQSVVSIDVAPLAVLGWVLGGIVVGAASEVRRFGAAARPARRGRPPSATVRAGQLVAGVSLALLGVIGLWAATFPYRVDAASGQGTISNRRTPEGPTATSTAIELAPWRVPYYVQLIQALNDADRHDQAEGVVRDALEVEPDAFEVLVNGARLAARSGDYDLAWDRYQRARELEPHHPDLAVEAAQLAAQRGDRGQALALAEEALTVAPDHPRARELVEQL